jgi:hypothetical protein
MAAPHALSCRPQAARDRDAVAPVFYSPGWRVTRVHENDVSSNPGHPPERMPDIPCLRDHFFPISPQGYVIGFLQLAIDLDGA